MSHQHVTKGIYRGDHRIKVTILYLLHSLIGSLSATVGCKDHRLESFLTFGSLSSLSKDSGISGSSESTKEFSCGLQALRIRLEHQQTRKETSRRARNRSLLHFLLTLKKVSLLLFRRHNLIHNHLLSF